jgi:cation:H+ antiporter
VPASLPTVALAVFAVSAIVALAASALLIVRLERIGARLSLSEAGLGLVAALAADLPEISTAVTALLHGQNDVGIGVILGSNVAKLAMLLGLAAIVAGRIRLDRSVVLLETVVAVGLAMITLAVVSDTITPIPGLALALLVFGPYVVLSVMRPATRSRLPIPARLRGTLSSAIRQEESDLDIHPGRGGGLDVVVAGLVLVVVVAASVALERSGTDIGAAWDLSDVVVGAVLLAVVTSIPNAVAAIYLARKGRGAATLSTTTNSNNINVVVGLLIPSALLGLGTVTSSALLTAWWYVGLTGVILAWAFVRRGLRLVDGIVIAVAYALFVVVLLR